MRFMRRALAGLVMVAVTAGLLAWAGAVLRDAVAVRMAGGGAAPPARERVFSARVMRAEVQDAAPVMTAYGEVRARRSLELRSPRAGTVAWLAPGLQDGARVAAGDVLMRLDPAEAQAALALAQADMASAEAERDEAQGALALAREDLAAAEAQAALRAQALARQEEVRARGAGSDAAVETAALAASSAGQAVLSRRQALATAEARLVRAGLALDRQAITLAEAERALAETELRAAFDGVLDGVTVTEGGLVSGNERIATLVDLSALEVALRLSTAQFARMTDGAGGLIPAPVTVTLEVPEAEIVAQGQLDRAGGAAGAGQAGRLAFAVLDRAAGFRPGDFVAARIAEPVLAGVIVLPATALGPAGSVLVLGDGDRLEEVAVEVLRREGDRVILRADVLAGREVVTERSPLLGAGIRVRPVRPGADEAAAAPPAPPEAPRMVDLTPERRAELIALVEGNARMPAEAKARVLAQLAEPRVPAQVIARIEQRMGG